MDGQNFQNNQTTQDNNAVYYQDNTAQYNNAYIAPPTNNGSGETPGLAIAGLVMGIFSIVLVCCCGVGFIFAIAGLIMAIVANKNQKSGVGTAALVLSIIGLVLNGFYLVYYIIIGGASAIDYMNFIDEMESL